ncbi:hypothetical protein GIS00_15710 [Nakamurella sp. YIM 132087]|uniref:Secreted protein n=2 Tax=Nakamurella alba TaxID=2665158 RepID=A0A7K1FRF2_9ACTN|nr:hypothetical protein [Nakamurella alba]
MTMSGVLVLTGPATIVLAGTDAAGPAPAPAVDTTAGRPGCSYGSDLLPPRQKREPGIMVTARCERPVGFTRGAMLPDGVVVTTTRRFLPLHAVEAVA